MRRFTESYGASVTHITSPHIHFCRLHANNMFSVDTSEETQKSIAATISSYYYIHSQKCEASNRFIIIHESVKIDRARTSNALL